MYKFCFVFCMAILVWHWEDGTGNVFILTEVSSYSAATIAIKYITIFLFKKINKYICNEFNKFCHRSWWTAFILIRLCPHWPPGQCHCSVTWDQPTGRHTVRKRGVQGWCTRCCLHCPLSSTQLSSAQLQQPFGYRRNSKSTGMAKN